MQILREKSWSPYLVGAAIGSLETAAMLTAKRPLGITTAFENTAAIAAEKFAPDKMDTDEYERQRGERPQIDWEVGLVGRCDCRKFSKRPPVAGCVSSGRSGYLASTNRTFQDAAAGGRRRRWCFDDVRRSHGEGMHQRPWH